MVVERSFAGLKGRFRRLKYLDMNRIDLIPQVVIAACVLHNICIMEDDSVEEFLEDDPEQDVNGYIEVLRVARGHAVVKRNRIMMDLTA